MILRAYRPEDDDEIVQLFLFTVNTVNAADYTAEQIKAWTAGCADAEKWCAPLKNTHAVVAEEDGAIVGFGNIDDKGRLDRLYVHAKRQGRGIATAICNELEGYAGGRITVHASVTARPFFERRGYAVLREQQVLRQGIYLKNYVMKKTVPAEDI